MVDKSHHRDLQTDGLSASPIEQLYANETERAPPLKKISTFNNCQVQTETGPPPITTLKDAMEDP